MMIVFLACKANICTWNRSFFIGFWGVCYTAVAVKGAFD